jgi:hypothetical protein
MKSLKFLLLGFVMCLSLQDDLSAMQRQRLDQTEINGLRLEQASLPLQILDMSKKMQEVFGHRASSENVDAILRLTQGLKSCEARLAALNIILQPYDQDSIDPAIAAELQEITRRTERLVKEHQDLESQARLKFTGAMLSLAAGSVAISYFLYTRGYL